MSITLLTKESRRMDNIALPLCLAAMDACWVYLGAWLLGTYVLGRISALPVPSPVILAAVELSAVWIGSQLLSNHRLGERVVQVASGIAGVIVSLCAGFVVNPPGAGGFSVEWLGKSAYAVIICLGLYFVGSRRATESPGFNDAYTGFRIGLTAISVAAVLTAVFGGLGGTRAWSGVGGVAIWFFLWSLGALALGNRKSVREEAGDTGSRSWGVVLFASIGGIFLLAALAGAFGTGIIGIGEKVVGVVLLALGFLVYVLFYVLLAIGSLFRTDHKDRPRKIPPPEDAFSFHGRGGPGNQIAGVAEALGIPPGWYEAAIWITAVLVLVLAVWIISRATRRSLKVARPDRAEERESLGSWALLAAQLRAWITGLFSRKQSLAAGPVNDDSDLSSLAGKPEWSGTLSVRQIYARLQKAGASAGYPRGTQQTPLEYLSVLEMAMPSLQADFAAITSAYIEARYGPVPASGPAVRAATEAWKRAEPALRAAVSTAAK